MRLDLNVACLIAGALLGSGCLGAADNDCGNGIVCPADRVCHASGCVLPEQLRSCTGLTDGEMCSFGTTAGECMDGACIGAFCGDGLVSPTEDCDGSNLAGRTCLMLGYYDDTTALACDAHCHFDTSHCTGRCGDHVVNGPELCEDEPSPGQSCAAVGYDQGHLVCTAACTLGFGGCGFIGWRELPVGATSFLWGVWGTSDVDVFVVGEGGNIFHYDGTTWSAMSSGTTDRLTGVWGSASNDVYAVGWSTAGTADLLHFDGTTWSPIQVLLSSLQAVWGSGPNDVFVGGGVDMLHYDGTTWTALPSLSKYVQAIWGSGPGDVYLVAGDNVVGEIDHYDGSAFQHVASGAGLKGIWGSGPGDVFVVGFGANGDVIMHFDGTSWTSTFPSGIGTTTLSLAAVWGSGPDDVFAVGWGGVLHYDGTSWSPFSFPFSVQLYAAWGSSGHDVIAVGNAGAFEYPGGTWVPMSSGVISRLGAVAGSSATNVYAPVQVPITAFQLLHSSDGITWSLIDLAQSPWNLPGRGLNGVWVDPGGEVFAVGYSHTQPSPDNTIVHFDPSTATWSLMAGIKNTKNLRAVWGNSSSDVFAVGDGGTILHYDGVSWSAMTSNTSNYLLGVWGSGASDVFAVGGPQPTAGGTIYHYDGTWTQMTSTPQFIYAVSGTGPADVYAVGKAGAILHYDGVAWTSMPSGTSTDLYAVWVRGPHDAFAVGQDGVILHLDSLGWAPIRSSTTFALTGVWGNADSLFFAGDGGTTLHLVQTSP
jgi:hypothetical protein